MKVDDIYQQIATANVHSSVYIEYLRLGAGDPPSERGLETPKYGEPDSGLIYINTLQVEKVELQSHPFRHLPYRKVSSDPAVAGISRCFRGLCGRGG